MRTERRSVSRETQSLRHPQTEDTSPPEQEISAKLRMYSGRKKAVMIQPNALSILFLPFQVVRSSSFYYYVLFVYTYGTKVPHI